MAVDWTGFQSVAEKLKADAQSNSLGWESTARVALQTLYYAAYHRAHAWAKSQKLVVPYSGANREGGVHKDFWKWMTTTTKLKGFEQHGYTECHYGRVTAAYYIDEPFNSTLFGTEWNNTIRLIDWINELPDQWPSDQGFAEEKTKRMGEKEKEIWPQDE